MSSDDRSGSNPIPSARSLVFASFFAFIGAVVLLVTVVLPVEYGIDPIRAGAALGLLREKTPITFEERPAGAARREPRIEGPITHYDDGYKVNSATFVLEPYDYVEYKYHLEKGASMVFEWTASSGVVHDFHGEADVDPDNAVSFDKSNKIEAKGSLAAPFTGIHGWYWENPGAERITVNVSSAGFYTSAIEIRLDGTRVKHDVSDPLVASTSGQ